MTTRFGTYALPSEDAFRTVLALGAGAALLGFVVAAFIPKQRGAAGAESLVTEGADGSAEPATA